MTFYYNELVLKSFNSSKCLHVRGHHGPDCRIRMKPKCLILSGSYWSRILIFKIFDGAGSDLESYPIQLRLDLKANAYFLSL